MKIHTQEDLKEILELHRLWVEGITKGERANISGADLSGADLSGANLSGACLSGADLSGANLLGADLSGADLSGADLSGADLSGANLLGANLFRANLLRADLSGADLSGADLSGANLSGANLSGADLFRANLLRANLSGANLSGADLSGADIADVKNFNKEITQIVPEKGSFIGFKKSKEGVIIQLEILKTSKRVNAVGSRKCRASKVKVVKFLKSKKKVLSSWYNDKFKYYLGKTMEVKDFDERITEECSTGIHFFLSQREAEDYSL